MDSRQYSRGNIYNSNSANNNPNAQTPPVRQSRKIYILTNGAKTVTSYKFHIYYDLQKSALIVNLRTIKKTYKSEMLIKLKLYIWYTLTVSWDELDGLRVYINNKLIDHNFGVKNGMILGENKLDYDEGT